MLRLLFFELLNWRYDYCSIELRRDPASGVEWSGVWLDGVDFTTGNKFYSKIQKWRMDSIFRYSRTSVDIVVYTSLVLSFFLFLSNCNSFSSLVELKYRRYLRIGMPNLTYAFALYHGQILYGRITMTLIITLYQWLILEMIYVGVLRERNDLGTWLYVNYIPYGYLLNWHVLFYILRLRFIRASMLSQSTA